MTEWIAKSANPLETFNQWYEKAKENTSFEPTKMVLATTGLDGWPSARTVLLKEHGPEGFYFYTNYGSRKAKELEANPKASLLFHWQHPEHRQVRIQGEVQKLSYEQSQAYFATRNRGSQIGAWASPQSEEIQDREELVKRVQEIEEKFSGKPVPCPEFWGGFRLIPRSFEFWQAGDDRLHNRIKFFQDPKNELWKARRLAP
jgi:pyridoxamine 5'-phosphate oxidase